MIKRIWPIRYKKYCLLVAMLGISVVVAMYFHTENELVSSIAMLGIPGTIFTILAEIWKENRLHDYELELQYKQQDFLLAASSHMAETIYDKHVAFCEEYINKLQKSRFELFAEGPSRNALTIGHDLIEIKRKHSTWLTQDIEKSLAPFESVLLKIGAKEGLLQSGARLSEEKRNEIIDEIYKSFGLVLGHKMPSSDEERDLAVDVIIEKLREILGVTSLTTLRQEVTRVALSRLSKM